MQIGEYMLEMQFWIIYVTYLTKYLPCVTNISSEKRLWQR